MEDLLSFITAPAKAGSKSSKKNKKKSKKKKGSTEEDKDANSLAEDDNSVSLTSSTENLDISEHVDAINSISDTLTSQQTPLQDNNMNGASLHAVESTRTSRDASLDEEDEVQTPEEEEEEQESTE